MGNHLKTAVQERDYQNLILLYKVNQSADGIGKQGWGREEASLFTLGSKMFWASPVNLAQGIDSLPEGRGSSGTGWDVKWGQ